MENQIDRNVVIIGGSGGIGSAFINRLEKQPGIGSITATYCRHRPSMRNPNVHWHQLDVTDEASIETLSQKIGEIDWLINAVGILHDDEHGPEKTIRRLDPQYFLKNVQTNALPTLLLAKHLHNHFKHRRPSVFATVSARVGSIGENHLGGWYSYRASKAALNMGIKTLSIEWQRTLPHVVLAALHPGTTDTALSKPFQRNVPADHLFSPDRSARQMLEVLHQLKPSDTGRFWSFDGETLPW